MNETGTTTMTTSQLLTSGYVLADNALQPVYGAASSAKWLQLYQENQTSLEISYTTGAAETDNYLEFYIEFGSGAPANISWGKETVEYVNDTNNQIVLEEYTYRLDGAAAGTAYTKRIQLPICSKGIRVYVKEVGVAANYGNVTIKANISASDGGNYNRIITPVSLEATSVVVDITKIGGTNVNLDDAAFEIGVDAVLPMGYLADETATDSVDEGDTGIARMTLDRKQINASELLDDSALGVGTSYVTVLGGFADETASDSVNEGDIGAIRMTLDRRIITAGSFKEDAAHTDADYGIHILAVRDDSLAAKAGTDGDYGSLSIDATGYLYIRDIAYEVSSTSNKVSEVNPLYNKYENEKTDLTNIATNTTSYIYYNYNTYKGGSLQISTSGMAATDTITYTLEASDWDDATPNASKTYQDVTLALTGQASFTSEDSFIFLDTNLAITTLRLKYVTSNGGGNDADLRVDSKKIW